MADMVHQLIVDTVTASIVNHPRSQQVAIGPSEIGVPCIRRLGHRLAGTPPTQPRRAAWLPFIGTSVHATLEVIFHSADLRHERDHGTRGWLTETRVTVGQIAGRDITGSVDLFHVPSGTVIDHKIVGPTTLQRVRRDGPSQQYRTQAHLYGQGLANAGYAVNTVAILYWAREADQPTSLWWSQPWDPQAAADALARADGIARSLAMLGAGRLIPQLPTADAFCMHCPWWQPHTTDLTAGCPGHPGSRANHIPPASVTEALGNPTGAAT